MVRYLRIGFVCIVSCDCHGLESGHTPNSGCEGGTSSLVVTDSPHDRIDGVGARSNKKKFEILERPGQTLPTCGPGVLISQWLCQTKQRATRAHYDYKFRDLQVGRDRQYCKANLEIHNIRRSEIQGWRVPHGCVVMMLDCALMHDGLTGSSPLSSVLSGNSSAPANPTA